MRKIILDLSSDWFLITLFCSSSFISYFTMHGSILCHITLCNSKDSKNIHLSGHPLLMSIKGHVSGTQLFPKMPMPWATIMKESTEKQLNSCRVSLTCSKTFGLKWQPIQIGIILTTLNIFDIQDLMNRRREWLTSCLTSENSRQGACSRSWSRDQSRHRSRNLVRDQSMLANNKNAKCAYRAAFQSYFLTGWTSCDSNTIYIFAISGRKISRHLLTGGEAAIQKMRRIKVNAQDALAQLHYLRKCQ